MSTYLRTNSVGLAGFTALLAVLVCTGCPSGQGAQTFNPFATPQQQVEQEVAQAPLEPLPNLASLPRQVDALGKGINPDNPAHNQFGQSLSSRTVTFPSDARLRAEEDATGPNWVLYAVGGLNPQRPPTGLKLTFSDVSIRVGVGLADFEQGNWVWEQIELPGEQTLTIPGAQMVRSDGALFVLLAVTPGNSASFNGGEVQGAEFLSESALAEIALPELDSPIAPPEDASTEEEPPTAAEEPTTQAEPITEPVTPPTAEPQVVYEEMPLSEIRGELVERVNFKHPLLADAPRKAQSNFPHIDPLKPARDDAGWPMSSGAARFEQGVAKLRSPASRSRDLDWVLYAVGGQQTGSAAKSLHLDFPEVNGQAWIGIPNYGKDDWDWRFIEQAGRVTIDFGDQRVLNEQGIFSFIVGVTDGSQAVFSGAELPDQSRPNLVGAYLSTGYWDARETESVFSRLESLGVNFVIDYALEDPTTEDASTALDAYLASAVNHGIGVAFPVDAPLKGMVPSGDEQGMDQVIALVAKLKGRAGISAWYVHDEVLPMVAGEGGTEDYSISLAQMKDLYQRIRLEDPDHPQLSVWSQIPTKELFLQLFERDNLPYGREPWMDGRQSFERAMREMIQETCDWVLIDSYPVGAPWLADDEQAAELDAYTDAVSVLVRRAARLGSADQPLYFVFQAFSYAQYGEAPAAEAPFPTAREMNAMLNAAWQGGATGAIAYSWFDLHGKAAGRGINGQAQCASDLDAVLRGMDSSGWPE